MADGTVINPGTGGDTVATDDIGGVKFQRVKLIHGADGSNDGDVATTNPFPVALSNLEKAEDSSHSSGHSGVMLLAVRKDSVAALAGTDLDYIPLIVDGNGRLWVTALIDTALPAGTNAIGKLSANSGVDIGDVDVTSVAPGTAAASLGKAEDTGHSSGDVGVMSLAVRTDTPANRSGTDGDYEPLQMSAGRLWVSGVLTANSGVDIGDVDVTSVVPGTGATNLGKAEDDAHASAHVGVMALAVRTDTAANRSGTDGDYEPLQISAGRLWTAGKELRPSTGTVTSVSDTASSTTLLASNAARLGATFFNDSTATLYLKYGATASTSSFTARLDPGGYHELPHPAYTGIVDGIWSADASGAVRVTEAT